MKLITRWMHELVTLAWSEGLSGVLILTVLASKSSCCKYWYYADIEMSEYVVFFIYHSKNATVV